MHNSDKEFERRFLVKSDEWKQQVVKKSQIDQYYISTYPAIRVRQCDNLDHYLTIKGLDNDEFEDRISVSKYERLTKLSLSLNLHPIKKVRHYIGTTLLDGTQTYWEVDVFQDMNQGLVVAEIELPSMESEFTKPVWLGEEITDEVRFKNSVLAKKPFSMW